MRPWASDLGYDGLPFVWDEIRRAHLRADLDAAYAHLYGLIRDELRYVLDPVDTHGPGPPDEREQAVFSIQQTKRITEDFGRRTLLDLTTPEGECKTMAFPLNQTSSCEDWFDGFRDFWRGDRARQDLLRPFRKEFIDVFKSYAVPVIQLRRTASKEAVCRVFEKVNTGGVALTAFELLTATYAAKSFNLREDLLGDPRAKPTVKGRAARMAEAGKVLEVVRTPISCKR